MISDTDFGASNARHPVVNLLWILLLVGLGFILVGPFIGFFVAIPFYHGGDMTDLMVAVQDPVNHPEVKIPLYIIQACATFIGLIVTPAVFLMNRRKSLSNLLTPRGLDWMPVLLTGLIVIIFMVVNSVFIEWNASVNFPDFAGDFERWAREREDIAAELTRFLTEFDSAAQLVLALVVIAILPAFGEEIVFRGLIQNELYRGTKNIHVSIWFAAVLFSAIHFQFFGFIPRLLLGALFGYLYYWSGSLLLAIFAHFVNNAVSVVALYFYQQGQFSFDVESQESAPVPMVAISALVTGGLLYYFYKYFHDRKTAIE